MLDDNSISLDHLEESRRCSQISRSESYSPSRFDPHRVLAAFDPYTCAHRGPRNPFAENSHVSFPCSSAGSYILLSMTAAVLAHGSTHSVAQPWWVIHRIAGSRWTGCGEATAAARKGHTNRRRAKIIRELQS